MFLYNSVDIALKCGFIQCQFVPTSFGMSKNSCFFILDIKPQASIDIECCAIAFCFRLVKLGVELG